MTVRLVPLVAAAIVMACGSAGSSKEMGANEGGDSGPASPDTGTGSTSSGSASGGGSSSSSGGSNSGSASGASSSSASSSSGTASSSGSASGSGSGASSSGPSSSSSGDSGTSTISACNFASGLNVPWVSFANDVPNPDLTTFNTIFKNTQAAGGRVVRWWFHTNGTVTPGYDSSGMAQTLPQSHIDGVKSLLAAAHTAGVAVNISLWSFDMLQSGENISTTVRTNNQNLLTVDANRQAYVDNYLVPLVTALKGTPGLYSYEIFNEPEGMTPSGWTPTTVPESAIQKTVNWFAAAIHSADPNVLVTNGSQEFQYCSNVSGKTNYYSDTALQNAGNKQNGTLDFYEVHYYTSNGTSNSCFMHPASYWGLDKKLVMGEFFAQATDGVSTDALYTYLYSGGYNGAWAWAYNSDVTWPAMQVPMQDVYNAHMADVGSCP